MNVWFVYFNESEDVDLSAAVLELWRTRDEARPRLVDMVMSSGVELDPIMMQKILFTEDAVMFDLYGPDDDGGRVVGAMLELPIQGGTDGSRDRREGRPSADIGPNGGD